MPFAITRVERVDYEGEDGDSGRTYHEMWHVYFTGDFSPAAVFAAAGAAGLPVKGEDGDDAITFASNVKITLHADSPATGGTDDNPCVAVYSVTYSQKRYNYDQDPLSRAAEIEWGGTDILETVRKDVDGNAILNSAQVFYDPLPERPIRGGECTITINQADNPADTIVNYSYTTNATEWFGVAADNAIFGKITAQKLTEVVNGSEVIFWRVTFPIRFRRDGWRLKLIDNGYVEAFDADENGDDDSHIVMYDASGLPPAVPALLDGSGHRLALGADPVVYPTDGFKINESKEWNDLPLPNPFA